MRLPAEEPTRNQDTQAEGPRYPVIGAHNHLGEPFGGGQDYKVLSQLLEQLDTAGMVEYVDPVGSRGKKVQRWIVQGITLSGLKG